MREVLEAYGVRSLALAWEYHNISFKSPPSKSIGYRALSYGPGQSPKHQSSNRNKIADQTQTSILGIFAGEHMGNTTPKAPMSPFYRTSSVMDTVWSIEYLVTAIPLIPNGDLHSFLLYRADLTGKAANAPVIQGKSCPMSQSYRESYSGVISRGGCFFFFFFGEIIHTFDETDNPTQQILCYGILRASTPYGAHNVALSFSNFVPVPFFGHIVMGLTVNSKPVFSFKHRVQQGA